MKNKNCKHKSFQLGKGVWVCQFCRKQFEISDIEKLFFSRSYKSNKLDMPLTAGKR